MPYKTNKQNVQAPSGNVSQDVYNVRIEKCEEKCSKKGNEYLNFQCDIINGLNTGTKFTGRKVFHMVMYNTDYTDWNFKTLCESCGIDWNLVDEVNETTFLNQTCNILTPASDDGFTKILLKDDIIANKDTKYKFADKSIPVTNQPVMPNTLPSNKKVEDADIPF